MYSRRSGFDKFTIKVFFEMHIGKYLHFDSSEYSEEVANSIQKLTREIIRDNFQLENVRKRNSSYQIVSLASSVRGYQRLLNQQKQLQVP